MKLLRAFLADEGHAREVEPACSWTLIGYSAALVLGLLFWGGAITVILRVAHG